jgi:FkbM family methyltransferase
MTTTKKKLFEWFVRGVPLHLRQTVFITIAKSLGIRSFTCDGPLGKFDGDVWDQSVHDHYFRFGTWAPQLQTLLQEMIFPAGVGTFVDIGANIGLTVIPVAARGIDCYAFEPDKDNFASLRKNICLNEVDSKIKAFNVALFSSETPLAFELSPNNMGDHRVRTGTPSLERDCFQEASRKITTVEAGRLDTFLNANQLQKPIVVKLDVQGSEVRVFEGGRRFFNNVDYLFVEYWPYGISRLGDSEESFLKLVREFSVGTVYSVNDMIGPAVSRPALEPVQVLVGTLKNIFANTPATHYVDLLLARETTE